MKEKKKNQWYPDLTTKIPPGFTVSTSHLAGCSVDMALRDGDRAGEILSGMCERVDTAGVTFSRTWRGSQETIMASWNCVLYIERRLDKGTGSNFPNMPWPTPEGGGVWSHVVGFPARVRFSDGGRTQTVPNAFIGAVDTLGVGLAYASYGYEKIRFIPMSNLVDIGIRVIEEKEDDAE